MEAEGIIENVTRIKIRDLYVKGLKMGNLCLNAESGGLKLRFMHFYHGDAIYYGVGVAGKPV